MARNQHHLVNLLRDGLEATGKQKNLCELQPGQFIGSISNIVQRAQVLLQVSWSVKHMATVSIHWRGMHVFRH